MSDIQSIFDRDPRNLTRDDITQVVERMRTARHQFNLGDKQAGSAKRTKAPKVDVNLDELELEIKE